MMNNNALTKNTETIVIQEATPAIPPSPPTAGYVKNIPVLSYSGGESYVLDSNTNQIVSYSTGTTSVSYTRVFVPGTAAVIGQPATPQITQQDFNLGWNSGAVSSDKMTGNAGVHFTVNSSPIGVYLGIGDDATINNGYLYGLSAREYNAIAYGFYVSRNEASVYLNGRRVTATFEHIEGNLYTIERIDGSVKFYVNSHWVYTVELPYTNDFNAYCSLFSGGDSVVNSTLYSIDASNSVVVAPIDNGITVDPAPQILQEPVAGIPEPTFAYGAIILDEMGWFGSGREVAPIKGSIALPELVAYGYVGNIAQSVFIEIDPIEMFGSAKTRFAYTDENGTLQWGLFGTKDGLTYQTLLGNAYSVIAEGDTQADMQMNGEYDLNGETLAYGGGVAILSYGSYGLASDGYIITDGVANISYGSYEVIADGELIDSGYADISSSDYQVLAYAAGTLDGTLEALFETVMQGEMPETAIGYMTYGKYRILASGSLIEYGYCYCEGGLMVPVEEQYALIDYKDYDFIGTGEMEYELC